MTAYDCLDDPESIAIDEKFSEVRSRYQCDKGETMSKEDAIERMRRIDIATMKQCGCDDNKNVPCSSFDHQVGGSHYKDYVIQPYEFFFRNNLPHHKAAIIRRICRYDHPTGKGKEDLEKIKHEIDMIIELEGY